MHWVKSREFSILFLKMENENINLTPEGISKNNIVHRLLSYHFHIPNDWSSEI